MRESAVDFCPVPQEQQPIHEYEELKDSWFFCWATLNLVSYGKKLGWVGFWGGMIAAPIAAASFSPVHQLPQFIISTSLGGSLFIILIWLRLYLGWSYISDRLYQERIFYEESGWYDGQAWSKPTTMLNRDRLIVTYEIKPIIQRLQKTLLLLASIGLINGLVWRILG
ncbi:MAG: CGLD27 family protein [Stanieria sp.]|jgi:hypothetical protein